MTPEELARLHATGFHGAARWSAESFASLLRDPNVTLHERHVAFLLGRIAAGEAEVLTLVTDPAARRLGHADKLLATFEVEAVSRGATEAFLEVAAPNTAARTLYARHGWREAGRRVGYYEGIDALILRKAL